jgi:Mechanosensitive ion channel
MKTGVVTSTSLRSNTSRYIAMLSFATLFACCINWAKAAQSLHELSGADVLSHLNASIALYKDTTASIQALALPEDVTIYEDNANTSVAQALRLAFQSANAEADIIGVSDAAPAVSIEKQTDYGEIEEKISARADSMTSEINTINKKIEGSAGKTRQDLIAQRSDLQAQLDSFKVLEESLENESAFIKSGNENSTSLSGQITDLARLVPEVTNQLNSQPVALKTNSTQIVATNSPGVAGEALTLDMQLRAMTSIDRLTSETQRVIKLADALRQPLLDNMLAMIGANGDYDKQSNDANSDPPVTTPQTPTTLAAQVKTYSNALTSLNEEISTLEQSESNLTACRGVISGRLRYAIESLLLRLSAIALGLASLMLLSKAWRAVALRYITDAHRRRQSLILRRITIGLLMGMVLVVGLVSEFSSVGTFAGFTTAGIAVSLNAVFLSMAAYFFVIGRYGIRVGDRITVSGITGEVVDIGLIRLYLMELVGSAPDFYPTGRLVEFSNSVLFQAAPVFKQIPGTDYTWHEAVVLVVPGGNYKLVQEKVGAVVDSVYANYRKNIERQHSNIEHRIEAKLTIPVPETKAQTVEGGVEVLVRYPVESAKVSEIDARIIHAISEAISSDASLKAVVSGAPKARLFARSPAR